MRAFRWFPRWLLYCALVAAGLAWLNSYLLDGLWGLVNIIFEDTRYAEGYSASRFKRVKVGMTSQQVLYLLGEPLGKYPVEGGLEGWRYSESPSDSDYRVRVILFSSGRVVKIIAEYYVD